MDAWSISVEGTKTMILDSVLHKVVAPESVKVAIAGLFEALADAPGYTDADPADTWAETIPHTTNEQCPFPRREEKFISLWRVASSGNPSGFTGATIEISPIRRIRE